MTPAATTAPGTPLLEVCDLRKTFSSNRLFARAHLVSAAQDVSFSLDRGQAVALVGESGSGKSTIARILLRLETADRGEIRLAGNDVLKSEPHRATLGYRGRVQMVFQDPFASLNPVHSVGHHLERPLLRHARVPSTELRAKVLELLRTVGLDPPEEFIGRYPHELSGGQRQRVAIARALAVSPDLLVADEPTSMLDVSIRMGVLNLLAQLKRERGLAILLITHDLASARYLADRILVLYRGRLVEDGPSEQIVSAPAHPYTRALLAAIAAPARGAAAPATSQTEPAPAPTAGPVPAPIAPPTDLRATVPAPAPAAAPALADVGCPYASRCPERLDICIRTDPEPRPLGDRSVRCHLYPAAAPKHED